MSNVNEIELTPMAPHLIPALWAWIVENNFTPDISVDASVPGVDVPVFAVKDNKVVLGLNPTSTARLTFGDANLTFATRFNKVSYNIVVPYAAILMIQARGYPIQFGFQKQVVGATPIPAASPLPQVGRIEFNETVRPSKKGRFGVVDGSKTD